MTSVSEKLSDHSGVSGDLSSFFNNIRIVLVRTSHSGNIGSAARAMKTMGLSRLYLVNPEAGINEESVALSAGASDVLENTVICSSLGEALAGTDLSVASSARRRSIEREPMDPRNMGETVAGFVREGRCVAVVFGCERTGLTNEEIDLCDCHVTIDADSGYSSLNLAMAVQVLCYEIRTSCLGVCKSGTDDFPERTSLRFHEKQALADGMDLEGFYQHLSSVLTETGFLHENNKGGIMRKIKRIFTRPYLTKDDINILRGILTSVTRTIKETRDNL